MKTTIEDIRDSAYNGQFTQARNQIKAYGKNKFLYDIASKPLNMEQNELCLLIRLAIPQKYWNQ